MCFPGIFPLVPLIGAWNSNNIGGSLKRGVGIAMQVGFGNLGGAIAGFVYLSMDEPRWVQHDSHRDLLIISRFIKGHAILIALISMSLTLTTFMTCYYRRENARRDAVLRGRNMTIGDYSNEMKYEEREMGDDAGFFRYTV
jgi:hypothetical protein